MKKMLLGLIVVLVMLSGCATTGTKLNEPLIFSKVVDVPGINKTDLYVKANMWFVDAFKSAESVIQFTDKESGVIKGKYIGKNVMTGIYICKISTTITVEVKDEKYRISFTDPMYQYIGDVLNGAYTNFGASGPVETVEMAEKIKPEWIVLSENLRKNVLSEASSW